MDPNQIIGMGVDAYNALDNESKHALTYPAAKTLGLAADGLISIFCYPFLQARIFTQARLKQYQEETAAKINKIPEKNRDSSKLGLVIKAIEESRYQLNEDDIRHMYVNLIASTVDNRKNKAVNPRLATVVSQLGSNEANFLKIFYQQLNHQIPFGYLTTKIPNSISTKTASHYLLSIDDGTYLANQETSIDILSSLGIIDVHTSSWLSSEYYKSRYQTIEDVLKKDNNYSVNKDENLKLNKCYLKFNSFGESLGHCIFE